MKADENGYDILLAHYHDFRDMLNHHLEVVEVKIEEWKKSFIFILVAEEFVYDLRRATEQLMQTKEVTANLIKLFEGKPPMGFLDFHKV